MREKARNDRTLVDLMLREAELAAQYAASSSDDYFHDNREGMHLRDGLWRHVLQFLESGTKLGMTFRNANPQIPWSTIEELRQDMTHDYPEVPAKVVRAFAIGRMPPIARALRRARFPAGRD